MKSILQVENFKSSGIRFWQFQAVIPNVAKFRQIGDIIFEIGDKGLWKVAKGPRFFWVRNFHNARDSKNLT